MSQAIDILQNLVDRAESLRTSIGINDCDDLSPHSLYGSDMKETKILGPPKVGGAAALVRFEIRARVAMVSALNSA